MHNGGTKSGYQNEEMNSIKLYTHKKWFNAVKSTIWRSRGDYCVCRRHSVYMVSFIWYWDYYSVYEHIH